MSIELPCRFSYKTGWGTILGGSLFFGAGALFMAYLAISNDKGLNINGIFTIGPTGASVFYWIIAALGAGFVVACFMLAIIRIANPTVIELCQNELLLPTGRFHKQVTRIAYSDIQGISEVCVSGQTFLYVTASGIRYTVVASLFSSKNNYNAVKEFLLSLIKKGE